MKNIKAILFDLDGTLLPMDQDQFTKAYFKLLACKLAPHGYDPKQLIDGVWAGTAAMVKNDGAVSNEEAFWNCFAGLLGEHVRRDIDLFDSFYREDFDRAQAACGFNPEAASVIGLVKEMDLRTALATNPLFPATATLKRIRWAGLSPDDFEFFTSYENSRYCKPNPDYYRDILRRMNLQAGECVMVGNDVGEDMIARELGMQVFLLTDCLINKAGADISAYPGGGFAELKAYLRSL